MRFFITALICIAALHSNAQSHSQIKEYALKVAKTYCSNAYEILQNEDAKNIAEWMDNQSSKLILSDFTTTVHESLHGYDSELMANKKDMRSAKGHPPYAYFIDNNLIVYCKFEDNIIKTETLHPDHYPIEVQYLFRYSTYIYSTKERHDWFVGQLDKSDLADYHTIVKADAGSAASSNIDGIYGLLEEFNAYFHDANCEFELRMSDAPLHDPSSTSFMLSPYYEFNIFMAHYLKYAKSNLPSLYDKLIKNKGLRTAYTMIESRWRHLLTTVYKNPQLKDIYPSYEGEDELFSNELREIMSDFMLPKSQLETKFSAYLNTLDYQPETILKNRKKYQGPKSSADTPNVHPSSSIQVNGGSLEFKDENFHYVVIHKTNDIMEIAGALEGLEDKIAYDLDLEPGLFNDGSNYYFYLMKFEDKAEAQKYLNTIKKSFPKATLE